MHLAVHNAALKNDRDSLPPPNSCLVVQRPSHLVEVLGPTTGTPPPPTAPIHATPPLARLLGVAQRPLRTTSRGEGRVLEEAALASEALAGGGGRPARGGAAQRGGATLACRERRSLKGGHDAEVVRQPVALWRVLRQPSGGKGRG